jgi:hypothetical protein
MDGGRLRLDEGWMNDEWRAQWKSDEVSVACTPIWVRIGIPVCFSMKGKVHPYRTTNLKGNHRITYQHSSSLFDTSVTELEPMVITGLLINTVRLCLIPVSRRMNRNDRPLPMLFSVADQLDQEGLLCHAQGGKSRPFRCGD